MSFIESVCQWNQDPRTAPAPSQPFWPHLNRGLELVILTLGHQELLPVLHLEVDPHEEGHGQVAAQ